MTKRISQLTAAAALTGTELVEVSQLSASVTITGTTISADSTDNSFNDSANGFVTAGFTTGKSVKVSGFTGNVANNIISGVVTSAAAGKLIIGGTDGDVIVTDAAGESVTITQWDSKRSTVQGVANKAPGAGRETLTAARTYYVRTDGSNSNNGLANTSGGAFLTIQKAVDVVTSTLDISAGITATIKIADGTYNESVVLYPKLGAGAVEIVGNVTTQDNVIVNGATCFSASSYGNVWSIAGLKLTASVSGFVANTGGSITYSIVTFGACTTAFCYSTGIGAFVRGSGSALKIVGASAYGFLALDKAYCGVVSATVTITGTPAFSSAFAFSRNLSSIHFEAVTWSGSATGKRYDVSVNSTVYTAGQATTWLPGSVAGTTATGGQYA